MPSAGPLGQERAGCCAVWLDGKLYVVGGYASQNDVQGIRETKVIMWVHRHAPSVPPAPTLSPCLGYPGHQITSCTTCLHAWLHAEKSVSAAYFRGSCPPVTPATYCSLARTTLSSWPQPCLAIPSAPQGQRMPRHPCCDRAPSLVQVEVLRAVRGSQGGVGEAVLVREVQGCREGPGVLLLQGLPGAGLAPAQGRVLRQGHPTLTAGAAACVPRPQIGLSTCSPGVCSGFVK